MLSLLRAEYLKLSGYKPFWATLAAFPLALGTLLLTAFEAYTWTHKNTRGADTMLLSGQPFQFPTVWQTTSFAATWLHAIPCLLLILSVCNEFQFRTHRQNLLDGWSRGRFFLANALLALLLAAGCTLCVALVAAVIGASQGSFASGGLEPVGGYGLSVLLHLTLALLLAFVLQKGMNTIIAFFVYTTFGEKLLRVAYHQSGLPGDAYFPLNAANPLVTVPVSQVVTSRLPFSTPEFAVLACVCSGWMLAFTALAWFRYRRQDL